ncbi:MAG TPA: hypothetical protein PLV45_17125, partial [bacterium]|nr:hypothetical protein [bacterium]
MMPGKGHTATVFLCVLPVFAAALLFSATAYLNDDAVISYRYAWNLARGNGLATWPGGPPEEGFSNPLLVLISAAGARVVAGAGRVATPAGLDAAIRTGLLVNHLAAAGILLLAAGWPGSRLGRWTAALIIAVSYPLTWYLHTGLEAPLYTFFVTAFAWSLVQRKWPVAAVTALGAALTRTEGILLVGWAWLVLLGVEWFRERRGRQIISWGLAVAAVYGLFTLWRVGYFGHLLPTPLIVKGQLSDRGVFDGRGLAYLIANARAYPLFTIVFILGLFEFFHPDRLRRYLPVAALVAGQAVLTIAVGGDEIHLGASRFILPVFPVAVIASVLAFERWRRPVSAAVAALMILACFPYYNAMDNQWYLRYGAVVRNLRDDPVTTAVRQWERWRDPVPWIDADAGRFVAQLVRDGGRGMSMASVQAGSLPIHWKGEFVDLLGLTTRAYAGKTPAEKDEEFQQNPPDILMAFRWEGGWFPVPSVALLRELGYRPVMLIQLQETIVEHGVPADYTINFLGLVRDVSILEAIHKYHWDGTV